MYIHSFLCGAAAALIVETVALMIATAWLKRKIYENDS